MIEGLPWCDVTSRVQVEHRRWPVPTSGMDAFGEVHTVLHRVFFLVRTGVPRSQETNHPLGTYSRTMPRGLRWSDWGEFFYERGTPV